MDLEARVKAYAEEARRILIQRLLDSRGQKGLKAFWQGYSTNGNGIVKLEDGNFKVVKVIGNIVVPKNSIVYIDEQNTVEVGFRKELPAARSQNKEQIKPTIADRIKRPLLLLDEDIPVGDIFMYYGCITDWGFQNRPQYTEQLNNGGTGAVTQTSTMEIENEVDEKSNKKCYEYAVFSAHVSHLTFNDGTGYSAVKITGTPFDYTIEIDDGGTNGTYQDDGYMIYFGQYSGDYTLTLEATRRQGTTQTGGAFGGVRVGRFQLPETKYYIQSESSEGEQSYKQLNLQTYFSDEIVRYDELHSYTRRRQPRAGVFEATTYLIFYVQTCDFSFSDSRYYVFTGGFSNHDNEERWIGHLKHWYLHLKINHATGTIEYRTTQQLTWNDGTSIEEYEYDPALPHTRNTTGRNRLINIESGNQGFPWNNVFGYIFDPSNYPVDFVPVDHQDILSQAYEGDWIYEWRNVQITSYATTTFQFLKLHYHDGVWYNNSLNGGPLAVTDFRPYTPEEGDVGYDGLPADNTYSSISNLVYRLSYGDPLVEKSDAFDGSVEGFPDIYDSWTTWNWVELGPLGEATLSEQGPDFTRLVPSYKMRPPWFSYAQPDPVDQE